MKIAITSALALWVLCTLAESPHAAPKKQRSYEDCAKLANDRGFAVNERGTTRRVFIERCMAGTVN